METAFKCCRKDVNVFYCLPCGEYFHPSCLATKKSNKVKKLSARRILCSEKCAKEDSERRTGSDAQLSELHEAKTRIRELAVESLAVADRKDERIGELEAEVDRLTADVADREGFIQSLRRRSTDFEDEVMQAEERFVREINQYQETVARLMKELQEIRVINESLGRRLQEGLERFKALETEMKQLNEVNRSMIVSIESLEAENLAYRSERAGLSGSDASVGDVRGLGQLTDHADGQGSCLHVKETETVDDCAGGNSVKVNVRRRVLVLCDQSGRGLASMLGKRIQGRMQTVIKPGAFFEDVLENIVSLTRDFGLEDYVVVVAGVNNFRRGICPSLRRIQKKIEQCSHTNVLLASVPYRSVVPWSRTLAAGFSVRADEYMSRLDHYARGKIRWLDVAGDYGPRWSVSNICAAVVGEISGGRKISNLRFVDTTTVNRSFLGERTA